MQPVLSLLRHYRLELAFFLVLLGFCAFWDFQPIYSIVAVMFFLIVAVGYSDTLISRGVGKAVTDIRARPLPAILVLITFLLFLVWGATYELATFSILFLGFVLYGWDSRILAACALIALATCVVLLILSNQALSEQMAICVFYLLAITVLLQLVEYKHYPSEYAES